MRYIILILIIIHSHLSAQPDQLKTTVSNRIHNWLDKKGTLNRDYFFDNEGFHLTKGGTFASWKTIDSLSKQQFKLDTLAGKPLLGLRIAIDPGHIGGTMQMANAESRSLTIGPDSAHGINEKIKLSEGNLTMYTALFLKKMLENDGAIVYLTRDKIGQMANGKTYEEWFESEFRTLVATKYKHDIGKVKYWLKKADRKTIFSTWLRDADLFERAKKINEWKPNVTIVIHYNVNELNTGWTKTTAKNFNMIFVGGAFYPNNLQQTSQQKEFFRMAVSNDLDRSIELGSHIITAFESVLNVKTATTSDAKYLSENSLFTGTKGIYCRNLALARMIHGVMIYGETLYQDNHEELVNLSKINLDLDDYKTGDRVKQVAEAYYKGIRNYFTTKR